MEYKFYKSVREFNQVNMTQYSSLGSLEKDYLVNTVEHEGIYVGPLRKVFHREVAYQYILEKARSSKILIEKSVSPEYIGLDVYGYIESINFTQDFMELGDEELSARIWYEDIVSIEGIVQTRYDALELTISYGVDGRNEFHCSLDRRTE